MRAISPIVGTVFIVAITVALATAVGAAVIALPGEPTLVPMVGISATAAPDGTISLTIDAGEPLDVRALDLVIAVDDQPLTEQPPVPFFSAAGFYSGPTGPFNAAADPRWEPGERAALRVAATNAPPIAEGSRVRIAVVVDGRTVAEVEVTAE